VSESGRPAKGSRIVSVVPEARLPSGIARLAAEGRVEGFRFVDRLIEEWSSGENRFAAPGERFLCLYEGSELVGFGGLNADGVLAEPGVGRVRHVYVAAAARGRGHGGRLVREIIRTARPVFHRIRLRTRQAAPFYESLGFVPSEEPEATHVLELPTGP